MERVEGQKNKKQRSNFIVCKIGTGFGDAEISLSSGVLVNNTKRRITVAGWIVVILRFWAAVSFICKIMWLLWISQSLLNLKVHKIFHEVESARQIQM